MKNNSHIAVATGFAYYQKAFEVTVNKYKLDRTALVDYTLSSTKHKSIRLIVKSKLFNSKLR